MTDERDADEREGRGRASGAVAGCRVAFDVIAAMSIAATLLSLLLKANEAGARH